MVTTDGGRDPAGGRDLVDREAFDVLTQRLAEELGGGLHPHHRLPGLGVHVTVLVRSGERGREPGALSAVSARS